MEWLPEWALFGSHLTVFEAVPTPHKLCNLEEMLNLSVPPFPYL